MSEDTQAHLGAGHPQKPACSSDLRPADQSQAPARASEPAGAAGSSPLLTARQHTSASHVPPDGPRRARPREYVLVQGDAPEPAEGVWASLPRFVCGGPQEGFRRATRLSSRAIVLNPDGMLLLSTTDECHEYVFAGGEIERGESDLEALVREVEEETGWLVEPSTARPVFSIDDYHNRPEMHLSMRQVNRYFVCQARPGGTMHLDKYEAVAGLRPALRRIDEAIAANDAILARKRLFWVERDTFVLKTLRDQAGLLGL